MPKAVMRSGASAPTPAASQATPQTAAAATATATTTPAPAAVAPAKPAATVVADPMRDRLKAMGLSDEAIEAALAANAAAKPAAKPAPAAEKPAAPVVTKQAEAAPVVAPVVAPVEIVPPAESAPPDLAEAGHVEEDEPTPIVTAEAAGAAPEHEGGEPEANDPAGAGQVTLQNHWSQSSGGALSGAIDRTDFKVPQLKIIQGSGPATVNYSQGDLVFCDQVIFGPPTGDKPSPYIRFIPVQLQKYFREELPKGSKLKPRNVMTPDEVRRLGGTTEWTVDRAGKRVKPTWSPAARVTVILEKPDDIDHPSFTIPVNVGGVDKLFAAAVYYVNGGAYRSFAKPIIDSCAFILKEGTNIVLEKRIWRMQTVKELSGEFTVFVPKVGIVNEATPPDLRAFAASLRGN